MHVTGPRPTRRTFLLLGVLSLAGTYACADRVVAPPPSTPELDLQASGVFVSTLWRPTDSGAAYLGGITGRAAVRDAGLGAHLVTQGVRPLAPLAEARSLDAGLTTPSSRLAAALEKRLATRTVDLPSTDGRRIRLRIASDPRGGGRPPMAVVIYENDRPVAINEYSYARAAKGWRLARSRSTMLDSAGRAKLVTETDVDRGFDAAAHGAPPDASAAVSGDPEEQYGDDYTDEAYGGQCAAERLDLVRKLAAWTAAAGALAAAMATTCTLAPPVCAAILLGAHATMAIADVNLGEAIAKLELCLKPPLPPPPPPPSTGGGEVDPGPGWEQWCEFENTYMNGVLVESTILRCWWVRS